MPPEQSAPPSGEPPPEPPPPPPMTNGVGVGSGVGVGVGNLAVAVGTGVGVEWIGVAVGFAVGGGVGLGVGVGVRVGGGVGFGTVKEFVATAWLLATATPCVTSSRDAVGECTPTVVLSGTAPDTVPSQSDVDVSVDVDELISS